MTWRSRAALLLISGAMASFGCGGGGGSSTPSSPSNPLPPGTATPVPVPQGPQTFVGAGDIGQCGSAGPEQTARLIDSIGGTVFTAGDDAYFSGTAQEFRDCYEPSWGRHKARTRPTPGNHEYGSPNAGPYFDYFGAAAGPSGLGYYSFNLGDWHAIALNSMIGASSASAQADWLRADLASNPSRCTLAYWHYPLFSSGPNARDGAVMRDIWRILYTAGVEVVINGHDHLYERFAPQDPDGRSDPAAGIRQFIVGTGGVNLFYQFVSVTPNSERQIANSWGVLKLTLQSTGYQWDFVPVSGPGDSGTGTCH